MAGPEVPATALWLPAARDHCASQTIVARICNLDIFSTMSTVEEIESAITQLGPKEVHAVADWLQEYREALWDRQIEADAQAGRLDKLMDMLSWKLR